MKLKGVKHMEIVVQKFGGTSVSTKEFRDKVAEIIIKKKQEGVMPVVVVSAMGRKGEPYATDTLINVAKGDNSDIDPRELDLLMSCGEVISCVVLANLLNQKGYPSIALTGAQAGIITDDYFGNAEVLRVDTKRIEKCLDEGKIPIISGFQGITENGDITTLGRGGSDTTASIIGGALIAKYIEIYTDVDGIMTADPRLAPQAKVIPKMSYHEVFQMAEEGAKVIHPKSVHLAMKANVPLIIKNTFNECDGTYITNCNYGYKYVGPDERIITTVAHIPNRTQVFIYECELSDVDLFQMLAENKISIDIISIFEDRKVFTIDDPNVSKMEKLFKNIKIDYKIVPGCTKVSIVGDKMRGIPGVMAKFVRALSKYNIKILQSADSHTTISCLIKSEDTAKAISALHDEFELG